MFRKLRMAFESLNEFQREYQRNMANGGMFVPTEEPFEFREVIELELELSFCDKKLLLQSEVVSRTDRRLGDAGIAGVAVQFLEPIDELRHVLASAAGIPQTGPRETSADWVARNGPSRRHDRIDTHAAANLRSPFGELEGRTRNVSRSGALLSVRGEPPPLGTSVRLTLIHPRTQEIREVEARVVRHAGADAQGQQIGLEFDFQDDGSERFVEDLCYAGGTRPASAISGPIEILGLPSLVQMFSSSADQGTLDVWWNGLHGRIVFAGGGLQHARVGAVSGMKALCRILAWDQGTFEFRPVAEGERTNDPVPMYGAILEGLQHVDELARLDLTDLPARGTIERTSLTAPSDLEKSEQTLLDLLEPGMTVEELVARAPLFDSEAYEALISLCDREVIRVAR
jgi:Tfp pilus assembly protein PilZ